MDQCKHVYLKEYSDHQYFLLCVPVDGVAIKRLGVAAGVCVIPKKYNTVERG